MKHMRTLLVLVALVACKGTPAPPPPPKPAPIAVASDAAAAQSARTSQVRHDRRVELVSIIWRLAGAEEYTRAKGTPYLDAVDRTFAPFAKHPAVAMASALRRSRGIGFDAPMIFAVHLDDQLALINAAELPTIDARWTVEDAERLATVVRAFATEAGLDAFLAQHADYHASLVRTLQGVIDTENPVAWFDAKFGPAPAAFVVIPSAIAGLHNFGPRATALDGSSQFFQVIGVASRNGEIVADDQLVYLIVHEMAHSYVNPVFAKHRAALEPAGAKLFALVDKQMRALAYTNSLTMLDESAVRAVTVNYMREKRSELASAAVIRNELRNGFYWVKDLAELFRVRSATTLDADMSQLIAFFDAAAVRYAKGLPALPFLGPVDTVHHGNPVWIVPGSAAYAYARTIHGKLRPTGTLVAPGSAPVRGHVVAIGTPADNPVVAAVVANAGWKIGNDAIVLGTRAFTGTGLVLIACWPAPDEPAHGVAVYTALDAADLTGINGVRHGSNDWLVARKQGSGYVVLGTGDFPRGPDEAWKLPGE